jgi:hypothetical protein
LPQWGPEISLNELFVQIYLRALKVIIVNAAVKTFGTKSLSLLMFSKRFIRLDKEMMETKLLARRNEVAHEGSGVCNKGIGQKPRGVRN